MNTPVTTEFQARLTRLSDSPTQLPAAAPLYATTFTSHESSIISDALRLIEQKRLRSLPIYDAIEDLERYLVLRFAGLTNEQGHVLYLDTDRRLLAADASFFGHQSAVTWDLRQVVLRAITLGAAHLVFAHNHPNDCGRPSDSDLRHLGWAETALSPLDITLLDSYVVTSQGITSIKCYRDCLEEIRHKQEVAEWEQRRAARKAKRDAKLAAKQAAKASV